MTPRNLTHRTRSCVSQRGAALLMAMVIVTLVATMAASMVWQQWRSVQVEGAERVRSQAGWVLSGALDWARLILKEDAKTGQAVDHLGEPWALPLAEARLSTFLAADSANNATDDDDSPEAFLSGKVEDAQAKYNLANLVMEDNGGGTTGAGGTQPAIEGLFKINEVELASLQKLCESIGMPKTLADGIAQAYLRAWSAHIYKLMPNPVLLGRLGGEQGIAQAPLLPSVFDDIGWLGLDAGTIERLRPFVTILPPSGRGGNTSTQINANTASKEVIAAVTGIDIGAAGRIVQARQRKPFKILKDIFDAAGIANIPEGADARVRVQSDFFEVSGRLRYEDNIIEQRHLVYRRDISDVIVLHQSRFSGLEPVGQGASPP